MDQTMLMNIAQVMRFDPLEIWRKSGHQKMRKDTPRPKVNDAGKEGKRKNGSKFDPGATAGGQIRGPTIKAGMPNKSVTNKTLTQSFIPSFPFRDEGFIARAANTCALRTTARINTPCSPLPRQSAPAGYQPEPRRRSPIARPGAS